MFTSRNAKGGSIFLKELKVEKDKSRGIVSVIAITERGVFGGVERVFTQLFVYLSLNTPNLLFLNFKENIIFKCLEHRLHGKLNGNYL